MINLVITRAVNIERTIPNIRVIANPLIDPVPKMKSQKATMNVVTLPSMIDESAL